VTNSTGLLQVFNMCSTSHFGLLVDCRNNRLLVGVTSLSAPAQAASSQVPNVKIITGGTLVDMVSDLCVYPRRLVPRRKVSLSRATQLAHPHPSAPLAIVTDASTSAMGAVLQQRVKNAWQPLAFFSKKLNPAQQKYPGQPCGFRRSGPRDQLSGSHRLKRNFFMPVSTAKSPNSFTLFRSWTNDAPRNWRTSSPLHPNKAPTPH
jgi:hypothetical protein